MIIWQNDRWRVMWDWPKGKMAWFMWGWRPQIWEKHVTYWRIGPLTLSRYDS